MDSKHFEKEGIPHLWKEGEEYVSDVEVEVIREEPFTDASSLLYKLEAEGKLRIKRSYQKLQPDYWYEWYRNTPDSALEYQSIYGI